MKKNVDGKTKSEPTLKNNENKNICRQVTVKHPENFKIKPTVKKGKGIQADVDLVKEFQRCRDESIERLDLSKSSITNIPASVKDCTSLVELYLYGEFSSFFLDFSMTFFRIFQFVLGFLLLLIRFL